MSIKWNEEDDRILIEESAAGTSVRKIAKKLSQDRSENSITTRLWLLTSPSEKASVARRMNKTTDKYVGRRVRMKRSVSQVKAESVEPVFDIMRTVMALDVKREEKKSIIRALVEKL